MRTLAVLALVIGLFLLFRWLGRPMRYLPHEKKPKKRTPDGDVPPPMAG